jgi:hypothetical protein
MRRLPFRLQDFTRIAWASDGAREVWQPRIGRISNAWLEIEWQAVVAGLRACCITMATPEQFVERGPKWAEHGLTAVPLAMVGIAPSYASTSVAAQAGKPFAFRMVLGATQDVARFRAAFDASDDRTIGELLGYPACCREFFRRVWVDEAMVDTTWPMAVATAGAEIGDSVVEVDSPSKSNILWRWMGVRAVSHLPCSFTCQATMELADHLLDVGRKNGFGQEMDWMLEILDWPVEWTAMHGVAEIKTPVLKVSTRTDATSSKYTVRYRGRTTPPETARGLRFPFLTASAPVLTESEAFRRGLNQPIVESTPTAGAATFLGAARGTGTICAEHPAGRCAANGASPQPRNAAAPAPWYATDNGFSTAAAMDAAHAPLLAAANRLLAEQPGPVLDLGCGNGVLLEKLLAANPAIVPFGIDVDPSRVAHARELLPQWAENFAAGNLFDTESVWTDGRRYALALLMPGRLLEVAPTQAARLRARLAQQCDRVLIYAYGDWLTRHGSLKGLAAAAGLKLLVDDERATAGLAEVVAPA